MPSSSFPPLIELIAATLHGSDGNYVGMATLIAPGLALTASHLVANDQEYDIVPRLAGPRRVATVARDEARGLAKLTFPPAAEVFVPFDLLSSSAPSAGADWQCVYQSLDSLESKVIQGRVAEVAKIDGVQRLKLLPTDRDTGIDMRENPTFAVPGISGAPVMVDNELVGVMAQDESEDKYCYAIPVTEMPRDEIVAARQRETTESGQGEQSGELNEAEFLARLSPSSVAALAEAHGMLAFLGRSKLHMEHLIAGLFQKEGGPTQTEFARAGLDRKRLTEIVQTVVETRLPPAGSYEPLLTQELPPLSKHVRAALIAAAALANEHGFAIRTRHLIRGALSISECSLIKALLAAGVDAGRIASLDEPAAEQPEPRATRRPTQAGIRSDEPEGEDLLDIKAEVEALCTVLASRDVKPPISLGLFGEWGSGKSFFMKKMEARFNELKEVGRQPGSSYCANIVQLWFNAWHYMDTNLWASLAQEIFDKLAQELARQDALVAGIDPDYERAKLTAERADATEAVTKAAQEKREADAKVRATEQQLTALQSGETTVAMSPRAVLREGYRFAVQQPEVRQTIKTAENTLKQKVDEAATTLNMGETPDSVKQQLLELQGLLGYLKAIFLAIRNTRNKWRLVLLLATFVIVVVAFVWLLPALLAQQKVQTAWLWLAGAALPLLATLGTYLPAVNHAVKIVRDAVRSNQESVEQARLDAERKLQADHQQLQESANRADATLQAAVTKAQELTTELDDLRADRKMSSFIRQRQQSSDYTRHLGVIAKARNDFEQLSMLIAKEQERSAHERTTKQELAAGAANLVLPTAELQLLLPRIDRIILYIDDLDRCPEDKVVDVLQAVHLLLAFPLFVVVVGVDPRWLLHSLRQHSQAFRDKPEDDEDSSEEERTHWQSTPLNYLEKIFQIPFTLWPMAASGFGKMVDTLTEPPKPETPAKKPQAPLESKAREVAAPQPDSQPLATPATEALTPPNVTGRVVTKEPSAQTPEPAPKSFLATEKEPAAHALTEPIDPHPAHLQIKSWERTYMKQLHQLIPSPRATKRFINVYRLMRAAVDIDERLVLDEFTGDETQGSYRPVLLLLAILTGYPDQATEILRDLIKNEHPETWWEFVDNTRKRVEKRIKSPVRSSASGAEQPAATGADAKQTANEVGTKTSAAESKTNGTGQPAEEKEGTGEGPLSAAEAERWEQLLEKLEHLRGVIDRDEPCKDFVAWAPKVARYSFQSGRVLLTRNALPAQNKSASGPRADLDSKTKPA
ncbi:MAG: hypothetical protein QOJ88_1738 [Pyrinomonadaceae bacterium]|nr:hypothetical protein [Pyrinomonadaceae bacterium]